MAKSKIGFADELAEQKEAYALLKAENVQLKKRITELEAHIAELESPESKARAVKPATQEWKAFT